jgi:hypothetical protein
VKRPLPERRPQSFPRRCIPTCERGETLLRRLAEEFGVAGAGDLLMGEREHFSH